MGPEISTEALRALIETASSRNPDSVVGIAGIKVIQRAEERPDGEDCFRYLFGEINPQEVWEELFTNSVLLDRQEAGVIVVYLNPAIRQAHVGVAIDSNRVRSKWGPKGHVYEHPVALAPLGYGDRVAFHKLPVESKIKLQVEI